MRNLKKLTVLLTACVLSVPLIAGASAGQSYESGVGSVNGEAVDRLFGEGGARPGGGKGDGGGSIGGDDGGKGGSTLGEGGA